MVLFVINRLSIENSVFKNKIYATMVNLSMFYLTLWHCLLSDIT